MYIYIYVFFFFTARDTQESAHAHKKLAIVTPFLLLKKGDKKIGDSLPFFLNKKGGSPKYSGHMAYPPKGGGSLSTGPRALYVCSCSALGRSTAGADENVRPPGQIGTRSRFIDDSFPPG